MRSGQAAAAEASRRRAAEECAQMARDQLSQYWKRLGVGASAVNLAARWAQEEYIQQAEKDAIKILEQREKEKNLEERRNKLAMLLFHEDLQQKEEMKSVAMQAKLQKKWTYLDVIPTPMLRNINLGIKAKEEEQRRKEAEILLYHQWRANQPAIREFEVKQRQGALKSAWMEQIIEKEMKSKQEEEDNEKILKERDQAIERQVLREKENLNNKEKEMKELQEHLCKQIQELRSTESVSDLLQKQVENETAVLKFMKEAEKIRSAAAFKRTASKVTFLNNMAMQARRLRERAKEAEKDVEADINELNAIADVIKKDAEKENSGRKEWQSTIRSTLEALERQKEVEKARQKHLDTVMDGEAKVIYDRQEKIWRQEYEARQSLLNDVLKTLKAQVQAKVEEGQKMQRQNIAEREEMLAGIEKTNKEVGEIRKTRERIKDEILKITSLQKEMKQLEREKKEKSERMQREIEIREAAKEEEKLRNEILRLQREGSAFNVHRRRRMLL